MKRIFYRPYVFWVAAIFIFYVALNLLLSGFYTTFKLALLYAQTVNWLKLGVSIFLSLLIGLLVALNAVLSYKKYKQRQRCREGAVLTGIGTMGGLATGFCPLCVTGIIPIIFGAFGASFSFAALPFGGIEIQVALIAILLFTLWLLERK